MERGVVDNAPGPAHRGADALRRNLVVGETRRCSATELSGFLCSGVISRILSTGELVPDEYCRQVLIAQAAASQERQVLIPLLILGTGGVVAIVNRDNRCSSRRTVYCVLKISRLRGRKNGTDDGALRLSPPGRRAG
jgi:hypothetical protein